MENGNEHWHNLVKRPKDLPKRVNNSQYSAAVVILGEQGLECASYDYSDGCWKVKTERRDGISAWHTLPHPDELGDVLTDIAMQHLCVTKEKGEDNERD